MSIKSELNNTKNYLSQSKKAILGRGGEISTIAGLKDLPSAIYNIPADTSLVFQEDSTSAYRKTAPSGAEEYAQINKVGGMTYKSNNLLNITCTESVPSNTATTNTTKRIFEPNTCIVGITRNNYYNANNVNLVSRTDNSFTLTLISAGYGLGFALKLKPNTDYTVSCETTATRGTIGHGFYDGDGNYLTTAYKESNTFTFTTDDYGNVVLVFSSSAKETFTVSNIMLNRGTTALPLEPFFEGLRDTKPTSLESRGANLFDESAITRASNNNLGQTNAYGVVENGYLKAKYSAYASAVYWLPFSMKLTKGTYTISADMYVGNVCPSLTIVIGLGVERKSAITARTNLYAYDTWERKSVTITLAEDNIYYFVASGMGDSTNYTKLDVRFKDIQIQRGETATEFHPFSAEPIDTLEIPEAVQTECDGWGLGIDAEYNNHIEWRNGRVIYRQEAFKVVLDGIKNKVKYVYLDNSGLYYGVYPLSVNGVAGSNLISSHFDKTLPNGTAGHIRLSAYSILMFNYNQSITTPDAWNEWLQSNPVEVVYPLDEPIETDITHLFTDTSPFLKVQGGGSIISNNERKDAVPSTLKYTIKVGS